MSGWKVVQYLRLMSFGGTGREAGMVKVVQPEQ